MATRIVSWFTDICSTTSESDKPDSQSVVVFVQSDAERLAELVDLFDSGVLALEVTRRIPLSELRALHAEAAEGRSAGKVIVIP